MESRKTIKKIRKAYNKSLRERLSALQVQLKLKPFWIPERLWRFGAGIFVNLDKLTKLPAYTPPKSQSVVHLDADDDRTSDQKLSDFKKSKIEFLKADFVKSGLESDKFAAIEPMFDKLIDEAFKVGLES